MLGSEKLGEKLRDVAVRIFAVELDAVAEGDEELPSKSDDSMHGEQLSQRWNDLLNNQLVINRMQKLAHELWDFAPKSWGFWLRSRLHETIGEALLTASYITSPTHLAEDSLLLDIDRGTPRDSIDNDLEIWLTEAALGGSGAVESLAGESTRDPHRFVRALEAAIAPSDVELTAAGLEAFVNEICEDPHLSDAVENVRKHTGHNERVAALTTFYRLLAEHGFAIDQGFKIALNHRVLREGTGELSDKLLRDLVHQWRNWENNFGVAIDLRTFSVVAASHSEFGPRIRELMGDMAIQVSAAEAAGVLSGILWPRVGEIRSRTFQSYTQFRSRGYTDPSLIRELLLVSGPEPIAFGSTNWQNDFNDSLAKSGVVRVCITSENEPKFHQDIYQILAEPIDVDYLQFYPVITEVSRGQEITITFVLRELF